MFIFDLQRFTEITEFTAGTVPTNAKFSVKIGEQTKYYDADSDFKSGTGNALEGATEIKLLGSFTMSDTVNISSSKVTLDLNGQTLTKTDIGSAFLIEDGNHTFEITDSNTGGQILHTYDIVGTATGESIVSKQKHTRYNINDDAYSSVISVGSKNSGAKTTGNANGATFNMTGGTILSNTSCVSGGNKSNISISGKSKLQSYMSSVVYLGNNGLGGHILSVMGDAQLISGANFEGTELKDTDIPSAFDSTKVTSTKNSNLPAIQVAGNFVQKEGTEQLSVTISGNAVVEFRNNETNLLKNSNGDYAGSPSAVYVGGTTKLTIEGNAKITSGGTGVEMRSGDLEVTGGTITSTATSYTAHSASSGTATFGTAIGIAQHGTTNNENRPVTVSISGNNTNISGPNALAVSNPQGNEDQDNNKITATIDGGNLRSTQSAVSGDTSKSGNAVLADRCNVFITVNDGNLNGNVSVTKTKDATDENTQNATVVVAGGTTTGTVKVVETTTNESGQTTESTPTTADEKAAAKSALKVMGGKVTDSTSASTYAADGVDVDDNGNVTESTLNAWTAKISSLSGGYNYAYYLGGTSTFAVSIKGGTGYSVDDLKYDENNRLLGIPDVTGMDWGWRNEDESKNRYLAKYLIANNAVTISPVMEGVKISGTGFIDNTITSLTATGTAESLGVYVDATDNRLAHIIGGKGKDSIKAGDRNSTLDGGDNDDVLEGGGGVDTFLYSAGNDEIRNYEHGTDVVSLTGSDLNPPIDFEHANFGGSNFVFDFGDNTNKLTFRSAAEVALVKGTDTYTYQGHTGGGLDFIAHEGNGISLGGGYGDRFNGTTAANEEYATINAGRVNNAIRITGNDKDNFIVASSIGGGTLEGGAGNDTLMAVTGSASTASLRFEGGAGADSMVGGDGYNVFLYTEGADSISGYHGKDLVSVRGSVADLENAEFDFDSDNIKLGFGTGDSLTFENAIGENKVPISIQSGSKDIYVYTKEKISHDKSVTLTKGFAVGSLSFAAGDFDTVNAVEVGHAISITGNDNKNYIYGSKQGGSLFGGKGDDKLDVTDRATGKTFVFKYAEGKDTVDGFVAGDKLEIESARLGQITKAKSSKSDTKLEFTFGKSDVLTFKSEDEIGSVSLQGGGFLTEDGIVSIDGGKGKLDLFASARGKIDLTDPLYSIGGGIASVDASEVKKQSVTIIGSSVESGSTYTFAGKNRKKDQFEYNGGNVTIQGYEAGVDKFDFNTAELGSFSVGANGGNVSLSAGTNTVVLESLQGQEVLLHHAGSTRSSFTKMVFKQGGVILNKSKRPTMATVSASYDASGDSTVKKILVTDDIAAGASIVAGAKAKTTIDASAATRSVSLIGGAKNDKLIGSTVAADNFVYTAGKDIIENYGSSDQISLGGGFTAESLFGSKISTGKRSIKFKFNNKNALTIKPNKGSNMGDTLNFSNVNTYHYSKNAISDSDTKGNATLTSAFSGSYKTKDKAVSVDGSRVEKNLTYKGTSDDETLTGGTKKTTFKGGGGNDSFTGGSGKDVFFYAKGDKGTATIADFDFSNDKVKIASGTITDISTVTSGGSTAIKFDMNSGRKGSANIGSFQINSSATYTNGTKTQGTFNPNNTLIKTGNTYYWFADNDTASKTDGVNVGDLITADTKVSKSNATSTGYAILDLGYSTNLVKAGVATKAGEFTFASSGITKK